MPSWYKCIALLCPYGIIYSSKFIAFTALYNPLLQQKIKNFNILAAGNHNSSPYLLQHICNNERFQKTYPRRALNCPVGDCFYFLFTPITAIRGKLFTRFVHSFERHGKRLLQESGDGHAPVSHFNHSRKPFPISII